MADTSPRHQIRALVEQASDLEDNSQLGKSIALLLQALQLCDRHLGPNHADTHLTQTILAYNYRAQGQYKDAERLDREVLSRRQRLLGDTHAETAKSLNNVALDLKGQGRECEALDLEKKAMDIMISVEGEEALTTLTSMNNLANSYVNLGRFQEAVDLHNRVLELRTRVLGQSDPLTIAAMDMLGGDYRGLGQIDRAIQLQQDAVRTATSSLGATHETTIKCMMNLAGTYKLQDTDEGTARQVALLEQAYKSLRRPEQEDSPLTIGLKNNLAVAYTRVDRLQDARALLVSCHEWNKRTYGPDHPRTQASSQNLAWILEQLGELARTAVF
ncbi:hypothetical protein BJX96DRAFT_181489 [Aspergillus floccosus]